MSTYKYWCCSQICTQIIFFVMVIYTTPLLLLVALLPSNLTAPATHTHRQALDHISGDDAVLTSISRCYPPISAHFIPATRTNKTTNDSTKPPEGPAAGHLRATNLRKSASADTEGQV